MMTQPNNAHGCCPLCGHSDGYMIIETEYWFHCKTHKTAWFVGDNIFSPSCQQGPELWQPDLWRRNSDLLSQNYIIIRKCEAIDWRAIDTIAAEMLAEVSL